MDFNELEQYANNPSRVINTVFKEIETTFSAEKEHLIARGIPLVTV